MELMAYLRILWRRKVVVVVVTLVATIITGVAIVLIPKTYTATVTLRVAPVPSGTIQSAQLLYTERVVKTYAQLVTTKMVMTELANKVGFDTNTPPEIEAEIIADTELLKISVKHRDPDIARTTVSELANMLIDERIAREIRVSVIEPAGKPKATSSFTYLLYAFLGTMVGLGAGGGLAFVVENLDTTLYTSDQIADVSELPVLGQIPITNNQQNSLLTSEIIYREAFRLIRVRLLSLIEEQPIQTLLITSSNPQEGKSLTAAYLALSLAQTDRSVVVVDADLHRPSLHAIFGLANEQGLKEFLAGKASLADVLQNGPSPNLHILTSGTSSNPLSDQPYSIRLDDVIKQLTNDFDLVVLDTPPVCALADAVELASVVDGVVLVASCGKTDKGSLTSACRQLNAANAKLLGTIVNRVKTTANRRYSAYY